MEPPKQNPRKPESGQKRPGFNMYWLYAILLVSIIAFAYFSQSPQGEEISWKEFENSLLSNHAVDKMVVVNKEVARIYIKADSLGNAKYKNVRALKEGPHYQMNIGSVETFEDKMAKAQKRFKDDQIVPVEYKTETNWFSSVGTWLLPILIVIIIWIFLMRRMSGGGAAGQMFNFGKSNAKMFEGANLSKKTFEDVAGHEEAKVEVREIIEFLRNPGDYTRLGAKIPKGVLLSGPPGTGKTLMAKAVAGEAKVPFFSLSGSDFVEMFVGVGASRVRDLFKKAKEKAPCIIFIDEIDAIGKTRGKTSPFGGNEERETTLNQLLTEMDGFEPNSGIIVLAATNRGDVLDGALMRPGRFDRIIHLDLPALPEREAIYKVHLKPLKIDDSVDVAFLARQTPGFSGADIANVCNEAAIIAARRRADAVSKEDFVAAIDRVVAGLEKKSRIITKEERKIIAFHEAGHAVVGWKLTSTADIVKVTIIPRGRSLGASWYLPEERAIRRKRQFFEELCTTLGGRAAEEVIFGEISSGALDDLEKVTKQAYSMVAMLGFDESIGNVSFYDSSGQSDYNFSKPYSEETAKIIDKEVKALVDGAYFKAIEILKNNRGDLERVAHLLLERETIHRSDLIDIMGEKAKDLPKEEGSNSNQHG